MFPYCKLNEHDVLSFLDRCTERDVRGVLDKSHWTFTDFIVLLSPAAAGCLDGLRQTARAVKQMHFGKTVRLYSPLYISNYCINDCQYCGFRAQHQDEQRRRLSLDEILSEAAVIHDYDIDSLLLVSGEDPQAVSVDFLVDAVHELKKLFSYISIEIYPMAEDDYRRLLEAGVHGVTLYQETYNQALYEDLHRQGPKRSYHDRLAFMESAGRAGFYNLGLGALLGLYDWRSEAVSLAAHGMWLMKRFWRSRLQFSFPRITPIPGEFTIPAPVSETELEQMMLAFRIFFGKADLYISTRESAGFRDRVVQSCASHVSAASRVVPGGYCVSHDEDVGQFTLNDLRSVAEIRNDLEHLGLDVVFKDWDPCLGVADAIA